MSISHCSILLLLAALGFAQRAHGQDLLELKPDLPGLETLSQLAQDPTLRSRSGREIYLFRARKDGTAPRHRFLIQGGLHGNEKAASDFVEWLARRYARGQSPLNALEGIAIDFLPYANPDGTVAMDRYNKAGVNLNRNFAVLFGTTRENPGKHQFSEPETRAVKWLLDQGGYTAAVDVHGYINWVVAPTSPNKLWEAGLEVPHGPAAIYGNWILALREEMKLLPGYQFKTAGGLGDGGAFEDYAFWQAGTLAFCLELESERRFSTPYRRLFSDIRKDTPAVTIDLYKRYETFLARVFERAMSLRDASASPQRVADETPTRSTGTH